MNEGYYAPESGIKGPEYCRWCSDDCQKISHGGPCPRVESIEYHPNGTIKKVTFRDPFRVQEPKLPLQHGTAITRSGDQHAQLDCTHKNRSDCSASC